MKPFIIAIALLSVATPLVVGENPVHAQDSLKSAFDATLESRKYDRFCFDYTLLKGTASTEADEPAVVIMEEGMVACMPERGLWLTRRSQTTLHSSLPVQDEKPAPDYFEKLVRPKSDVMYTLYRSGTVSKVFSSREFVDAKQLDRPIPYPTEPFDFRALGIGFYGDIVSHRSLEEIIQAWRGVEDTFPPGVFRSEGEDKIMTIQTPNRFYEIDYGRDCWFTAHRYTGTKKILGEKVPKVLTEGRIELGLHDGEWLPDRAEVSHSSGKIQIFFTWRPKEEVKPEQFSLDYVRELMRMDREAEEKRLENADRSESSRG